MRMIISAAILLASGAAGAQPADSSAISEAAYREHVSPRL